MVSARTMGIILAYSVPYINENLASLDFLTAHVKPIDGKTPFYDDETRQRDKRRAGLPHLKDSWRIEVSGSSDNTGYVYLTNTRRTKDSKYVVADLLWEGTAPYFIHTPTLYSSVVYSTVPGVGQTQRNAKKIRPKYQGHDTKKMSYFWRFKDRWFYNKKHRSGIRDVFVRSFKEFILLCVENGVREGLAAMEREGIISSRITNVQVRVLR